MHQPPAGDLTTVNEEVNIVATVSGDLRIAEITSDFEVALGIVRGCGDRYHSLRQTLSIDVEEPILGFLPLGELVDSPTLVGHLEGDFVISQREFRYEQNAVFQLREDRLEEFSPRGDIEEELSQLHRSSNR